MTRISHGPRVGAPLGLAPRNESEMRSAPLWLRRLIAACWVVGLLAVGASAWLMLVEKW